MRNSFLSFSLPLIGNEEIDEVVEALKSGWLTSGPRTKQFEQEFRDAVQAPAALALNCRSVLGWKSIGWTAARSGSTPSRNVPRGTI